MRYAFVAALSFREAMASRGLILARAGFLGVILLVFSRLWTVAAEEGKVGGFHPSELLWYLALVEWVVLSVPVLHLEIQDEIRRGDVAGKLIRPISYLGAKLAEGTGRFLFHLLVLGVAAFGLALLLSGGLPPDPRGLLFVLPIALLSGGVQLLFLAGIGLAAFELQDATPLHWIWQKLLFVLGGLMLPLEIYPDWLQAIAHATPFAPLLHGLGRNAFGLDAGQVLATLLAILAWGGLVAFLLVLAYRAVLRRLEVNGG